MTQMWLSIDWDAPAPALRVLEAYCRSVRPGDPCELAIAGGPLDQQAAGARLRELIGGDAELSRRAAVLPDIVIYAGGVPADVAGHLRLPGAGEAALEGLREELATQVTVTPVLDNEAWARTWRPEAGFRHLVADNVSSDATAQLLSDRGADVVVNAQRHSRVGNWRRALELFREEGATEWMKWWFAGDELLPGAAAVLDAAAREYPDARLIVAEYLIRHPDGGLEHWRMLPETRLVAPAEALALSAERGNWFGSPIGHSMHRDVLGDVEFGCQPWVADWQACLSIARRHPVLYLAQPIGVFDMASRRYHAVKAGRVDSLVQELSLRMQSLEALREVAPSPQLDELEHRLNQHAAQALGQRVAQLPAPAPTAAPAPSPAPAAPRSEPVIAVHAPRVADPAGRDFNGYAPLFAERHATYAYLPQLAGDPSVLAATARGERLRLGGTELEIVTDARELNQLADILVGFEGRPYLPELAPPAEFTGLKAYHVMDFVFHARDAHEALVRGGVDVALGYNRHDEHSPFFRALYPSLAGRTLAVPFGFAPRFRPLTPFAERERSVIGLGSVNPVDDPLCPPGELDDYVAFHAGVRWTHAWRRALLENAGSLADILVSRFPVFPETKDPSYDAVGLLNAHALFANDTGLMNFPPARTYEGPAAGALLVGDDTAVHHEIGFRHGVNALLHRPGDVQDFARVVREALAEPEHLAALAAAGERMVRERYAHAAVADTLAAELRALWAGRSLPESTPAPATLRSRPVVIETEGPLVTALICAYNYAGYLPEAIDSALAQDYANLEVLVVDDGSTDETPAVLAAYGDRIRVVRQDNAGLNAATARGIAEARGELVALLDADDAWHPEKVRRQVELFQRRPEVGLVFTDMETVDGDGRPRTPSHFREHGMQPPRGRALGVFLQENFAPAPSLMVRRELAERALPVAAEASCQDWWLALRVGEVAEIDWIDAPLVRYRIHGDNMSGGTTHGERWIRNVRLDNDFRRWMLRELDLREVDPEHLRSAVARLELHAGLVARAAGTTLADELAPSAEQRAASAASLAAAASAADPREALLHTLAAVASDPLEPAARQAFARALETAAAPVGTATLAPATAAEAERELDAVEAAFAAGDIATAGRALLALTRRGIDSPALAARAHSDLAVVAVALEDLEAARLAALEALGHEPGHVAALETLGRVCEAEGDRVQAAHWFARAAELDPEDPSLPLALADTQFARARWADAHAAYERAAALAPLSREAEERRRRAAARAIAATAPAAPAGKRGTVLLVGDYFHPSIGGAERLVEGVGIGLKRLGWKVEVATRALPERTQLTHLGMRIHEISGDAAAGLHAVVERRRPDAVLVFSAPNAWPVPATLSLPPGPRVVAVPCINPENNGWLHEDPARLQQYVAGLDRADVLVRSSHAGVDAQLADELGIPSVYVPNAAATSPLPGNFRDAAKLRRDVPLLLAVGNMWPEKNHAGLLATLANQPGDWQLAIIGRPAPGLPQLAAHLSQLAGADRRVKLIGGASPHTVAAAMRDSDLLLLPSSAEATPLVLVEAMSRSLPWIATPACGAAHDHAGGLIVPLADFGSGIDHLLAEPAAREELGRAGHAHWKACYRWEEVCGRYDALLRGAAALGELAGPAEALEATDDVRAAHYDSLVGGARAALAATTPARV